MKVIREKLGARRLQLLIALLVITGISSTLLQSFFPDESWLAASQTALFLVFVFGTVIVINSAFSQALQKRVWFAALPAALSIIIGLLIPGLFRLFLGGAVGWLLVSQLVYKGGFGEEEMRGSYKKAIKAMRKQKYDKAVDHMTTLINREPEVAAHYGFRAQLYRLQDNFSAAERDYQRAADLDEESPLGANGLAEVYLQQDKLDDARKWAELAYKKASDEWVTAYNLGMIAERQHDEQKAIQYLKKALKLKMPDSRHRLLTKLWIARIYHRQGKTKFAQEMVAEMKKEAKGLREWKIILESDEAAHLMPTFRDDVRAAKALMDGESLDHAFAA